MAAQFTDAAIDAAYDKMHPQNSFSKVTRYHRDSLARKPHRGYPEKQTRKRVRFC